MSLGNADPFGERLLSQATFESHLSNARSEQFTDGRCVSGMSHRILTNEAVGSTLFNS
jgi:hypothetical protein